MAPVPGAAEQSGYARRSMRRGSTREWGRMAGRDGRPGGGRGDWPAQRAGSEALDTGGGNGTAGGARDARLRLALDGTPLLGNRTGVGEVVAGLLTGLASRPGLDVAAYVVSRRGHADLSALLPPGVRPAVRRWPARVVHRMWRVGTFPRLERWTGPVDVVHATNYVAPPTRSALVVSVYDLTVLHHPELSGPGTEGYPGAIRRAVDRGAWIHTSSHFVAGEIRDALDVDPERVVVVPLGIPPVQGGDPAAGRRRAGSDRYVLTLGTVEPRKNLPRLVAAFDAVAGGHRDVRLVVAGAPGWDAGAFERARTASPNRERILHLGYVGPAERADLMAGATLFAFPSLYEGFGFPPLEAMAAGVPVVASVAGSLPEVLGDAAALVEPTDTDALAGALEQVLHDPDRAAELTRLGRLRARIYSWDAATDGILALYRRAVDGHGAGSS